MPDTHQILGSWNSFLRIQIGSERRLAAYNLYVRRLVERDLPVIFDFGHLSALLGLERKDLAAMVNRSSCFYRSFEIPKRRGGTRKLAAPYPALLEVQRWINRSILAKETLHEAVHGYAIGRSVVTNAQNHVGKRCIVKIDISDFFPSIQIARVVGIFQGAGYAPKVAYYLAALCCHNGRLPQGAATSPALSNIIAKGIDRRVAGLAVRLGLAYSRYADDMVMSGPSMPLDIVDRVTKIVRAEGFHVNTEKTVLSLHGGKRIVTGISVSGKILKLPRAQRRELRKQVHFLERFGFAAHTARIGSRDPILLERLLGKLSFWKLVEPANGFVEKAIEIVQRHRLQLNELH
jgi:RNA-directed DNA polymerase